jgi:hypothetical protein
MPKLSNVTVTQINEAMEKAEDLIHELNALTSRIGQGYCDPLDEPAFRAQRFIGLARASAEMAGLIISKAAIQELKVKTEIDLRGRLGAKAP